MNIGTLNPICYYFFFRNQCLLSCLCLLFSLFSFDKSKARAPSHVRCLPQLVLSAAGQLHSSSSTPLYLRLYPTPSQALPKLNPTLKPGSYSSSTMLYLKQQLLLKVYLTLASYSRLPNSTCCSTQAAPSSIIVTGMPGCPLRRNANHKF